MATTQFTRRDAVAPVRREVTTEPARRARAVLAQMYAYFDPAEPSFTAANEVAC